MAVQGPIPVDFATVFPAVRSRRGRSSRGGISTHRKTAG